MYETFSMILKKTQTANKDLMAPSSASISAPYCHKTDQDYGSWTDMIAKEYKEKKFSE